jgi:hypothetical protein
MGMRTFAQRVTGAMRLDPAVYEEVEAHRGALPQALAVVLLASVAAGVGGPGELSTSGIAIRAVVALVSWVAWAAIVMQLGGGPLRTPETRVDMAQLLRTLGFAAAPGLIQVLGVIRPLAGPVQAIAWIWMFAAMVMAVRQALDFTRTERALLVCLAGITGALGIAMLLGLLFSTPVF